MVQQKQTILKMNNMNSMATRQFRSKALRALSREAYDQLIERYKLDFEAFDFAIPTFEQLTGGKYLYEKKKL